MRQTIHQQLKDKHVRVMMIVKSVVITRETMNEVMNPSGGRLGRDKNTISGHENSRIAK